MTTYEHGKQPDGAPVTWEPIQDMRSVHVRGPTMLVRAMPVEAEHICRAFHLAKLAEDAEGMLSRPRDEGEADWLRRYREIAS